MTDARTDALTAPTADPGIVHALVYVGDQIAAMAAGSDRNRPRNAEQATGEGLGEGPPERRTGPRKAKAQPAWTNARARIAALSRSRQPDDPELLAARAELKAARFAEHVEQVVDAAPALTAAQRAELVALLNAGVAHMPKEQGHA